MKRLVLLLLAFGACTCRHREAPRETVLGPPPPATVRRIVTLAPSLTELVVALGARPRLVGVSRYDDAPEVASLPRVGGYNDPSAETILTLHPDLVLAQPSPGNKGAVELVASSGTTVVAFALETLADVEHAIRRIGALLDRKPEAAALVRAIESAREHARAAAQKRGRRLRVALLFDTNPIVAAGPGSFAAELLEDAGGDNLVARSPQPYPQLPVETLLAKKPDVVLVTPMGGSVDALPPELRAKTRVLKNPGILHPGPQVVGALGELTQLFDALEEKK